MLNDYLEYLKDESVELHIYAFDKRAKNIPEVLVLKKNHDRVSSVKIISMPSYWRVILNIFIYCFIVRTKTFQESLFFSKNKQTFLLNEINTKCPDIIFCDLMRTAQFLNSLSFYPGLLTIFGMDDIFSKRYRILLNEKGANFLGNLENQPGFSSKVLMNPVLKTLILSFEAVMASKNELVYASRFSKTLLVSPQEVDEFTAISRLNSIYYLYPSTNLISESISILENINRYSLSYMGFLGSAHNERGLIRFLKLVFNQLLVLFPDISLDIIGEGSSTELRNCAEEYKNRVKFHGFVSDFESIICKTNIFVAPTYFGTGIKTKIIDAMGLGMPVATTAMAVEGLKIAPGFNIMVANDDKSFSENIATLILNSELNIQIRKNALEYVKTYHSKVALKKTFLKLLEICSEKELSK